MLTFSKMPFLRLIACISCKKREAAREKEIKLGWIRASCLCLCLEGFENASRPCFRNELIIFVGWELRGERGRGLFGALSIPFALGATRTRKTGITAGAERARAGFRGEY